MPKYLMNVHEMDNNINEYYIINEYIAIKRHVDMKITSKHYEIKIY